jgi:hypothetical protein
MHDHLSPHTTGAIEVVPTSGSTNSTSTPASNHPGFFARVRDYVANLWQRLFAAPAKKASISGQMTDPKLVAEFKSQNEQAKYKWLEDIAQQYNPETAWAYVKAAYDTPAGVVGNAHDMAHLVGQLIFKQYGFDGLSICDPTFAFGCFHGFMEVAFDKEHPEQYESNLQKGQDSCKALGDMKSPSYWSCIHGMGHGIASYRDYDLDSSLTDCDRLDPQVRTYCHDGVFMEFLNKSSPHFYKTSDPIYPCDTVGEEYKIACARSQATVMRVRLGMTTPQIADACLATHNDKIMFNCIDSIGYFIGQTNAANASQVVTDCREIREDAGAAQCMAAAAGELVFQDSVGWREGAQQICSSLRGTYKDLCFARVDQVKQSYGRK